MNDLESGVNVVEGTKKVKEFVRKRYGEAALRRSCCAPSCCSQETAQYAKVVGYSEEEIKNIPPEAIAMGMGCGNPTALADLKEGEIVLDLGSGGGVDVFLASKRVGPKGSVIGVDMTDEMIAKARETAERYGYQNVEFRKGEIESLPVDDNSVDIIISNCVINLSPDKLAVFREAFRVLKPGGRLLISDLVTEGEIPEDIRRSFEAWAACIAGALEKQEYLDTIKEAGFDKVAIVHEHGYTDKSMDGRLKGKILSVQVKAYKQG